MNVREMMKKRIVHGVRIAAVLGIAGAWSAGVSAGTLYAQHASGGATPLTLDEAVRLAERHNPAFQRTTNSLELNDVEEAEAWLQLLPRPHLTLLSTSMSWNLQRVGTDPFGNPLPNPEARMVQSSQTRQQAGLAFSFNLADYARFRNRAINGEVRLATAANQLHELHTDVWRAFLDVQERQVTVALEEELLDRHLRNREVASHLYALAQREHIDLLEADLDVAIQEEQLRQSRGAFGAALLQLRNVIGDATLGVPEVTPVPFRTFDPGSLDEEALVRAALASSPAIALQEVEVHRSTQAIAESRYQQWLPTVSLGFSTSRSELARDGGGAFFQPNPTGGWDRNVSIAVSLPDLGRVFGTRNTIRSHQIARRNADETLRERRLQVEQDVRTTLVNLRTAHASVALQERRIALARERLAERLESYRLGRGTYQDLQIATDAVANAERALLTVRYQLERALVTLEQTLGLPLEGIAGVAGN